MAALAMVLEVGLGIRPRVRGEFRLGDVARVGVVALMTTDEKAMATDCFRAYETEEIHQIIVLFALVFLLLR